MPHPTSSRRRHASRGFTLVELLVSVAIIGIVAMLAVPNLQAALSRSRRNSLVSDARLLFSAFTVYNTEQGEYPPCCTPPSDALNQRTLFPLTRSGYIKNGSAITSKLRAGSLTTYDSPDNPGPNSDFFAVMTSARDPRLQILVADTDEYPGHAGVPYYGVYLIRGSTIVSITDINP